MPSGAFKTALGSNFNNVSGTTLVITTTAAIAIGDLVVVRVAADNLSATTPTFGVSDSGSNVYTSLRQGAVNATAAAGIAGGMLTSLATAAVASGGTITVTLSGAVVGKAAYAESFTGITSTARVASVGSSAASGTAATSGASAAGVVAGDLVLGFSAVQTRAASTGDADTTNGSWSAKVSVNGGGTSGQDATSVQINGQYKIATAAGAQTYDNTVTSTYWVTGLAVLQAVPDPAITQAAYQFFDDAGTETGAASLAALNTATTGNLANGDGFGVLRVRLQLTTAVAAPATDDWQLQWEKNGNGTWTNITTGGTTVQGYDNPNLTGGAVTTTRLGAGTGSFVAGKISETGDVPNLGWTASNYTELVYSLKLLAVNFVAGDTLRFRVLRNGATTGLTYTQTPTINIVKATSSLVDNFATTVDKTTNWPNSSAQVVWDSPTQSAKIPCTTSYYSMNTVQGATASYIFIGSSLVAQVTPPALGTGTREIFLEIQGVTTAQQKLNFYISGTTFAARYMIGGTATVVRSVTWNQATYGNWWRIRESAGTIYWDTSLDGTTWTNFTSVATSTITWSLNQVSIGFSCGYYGTETADNGFIDNVNVTPYVLAPLDTANASSADTTTVTPIIPTTDLGTPLDTANANSADIPALTQVHVLAPLDTANASSADVTTLTQLHILAPLDTANADSADIPAFTQIHVLAPLETFDANSADIPTLSQVYVLAPVDTFDANSADIPVFTQLHKLAPLETFDASSTDIPVLTGVHLLGTPLDTANASSTDIPALTQVHKLAPLDTANADSIDTTTITSQGTLVPARTSNDNSADISTLTQVHMLAPLDTANANSADIPTLVRTVILAPLDTANGSTADIPVLVRTVNLAPLDTANANSADTATVVPPGLLAPAETTNTNSADTTALTQLQRFAPADTFNYHGVTTPPTLVIISWFTPARTVHANTSDDPVLLQLQFFQPADTLNTHMIDSALLFVGVPNNPLMVLYPDSVFYVGAARVVAIYEGATQVWPPNGGRLVQEPAMMEG